MEVEIRYFPPSTPQARKPSPVFFYKKSYQWVQVMADNPTQKPGGVSSLYRYALARLWDSGVLWGVLSVTIFLALSAIHYEFPNFGWTDDIIPAPTFAKFLLASVSASSIPLVFLVTTLVAVGKKKHDFHSKLHRLLHIIRNEYCQTMETESTRLRILGRFSIEASDEIERFFASLLGKNGKDEIGCCIRVADSLYNGAYVTYGRSYWVSGSRNSISQRLSKRQGLAKAMLAKIKANENRVFLARDIKADDLVDDGVWQRLKDSKSGCCCDDDTSIQSLLACPINCRESGKPVMIGILYVTSPLKKSKCPFTERHGEIVSAIADVLGCLYQEILKQPA